MTWGEIAYWVIAFIVMIATYFISRAQQMYKYPRIEDHCEAVVFGIFWPVAVAGFLVAVAMNRKKKNDHS